MQIKYFTLAKGLNNCIILKLEEFRNCYVLQTILSENGMDRTCSMYGDR
jgi:hypothetical protein